MSRHGFLRLPEGWRRRGSAGLGPFVTREVLEKADGTLVVWESRRHRKRDRHPAGSTWWAPTALGWWIGVLFALGSACFALGALPAYADALGAGSDSLTYFVGSLFFTTAALLQYGQVAWVDGAPDGPLGRVRVLFRPLTGRIDWWASVVQLAGTVFFNVSTGHAAFTTIGSGSSTDHLVWRPDAFGSVCFLVASWLAWAEVSHGVGSWRPHQVSWWIAALNLVGSVAFGVSAVASKVEPNGSLRSLALTNLGTFVGALCFLAGGLLLLPERTEGAEPEPALA